MNPSGGRRPVTAAARCEYGGREVDERRQQEEPEGVRSSTDEARVAHEDDDLTERHTARGLARFADLLRRLGE